jgi:hypothetical protein
VLVPLAACSDAVPLDAPRVSGADARACSALVRALPDELADQRRRQVDPGAGYGAAWGDPAIELRCGVRRPAGLGSLSECQRVDGVDWYIPESQQSGEPTDITMTTVGRAQYVEVRLPKDYFPPANAMVDLARTVRAHDRSVRPCL